VGTNVVERTLRASYGAQPIPTASSKLAGETDDVGAIRRRSMRTRTAQQPALPPLSLFSGCTTKELKTIERLASEVVLSPGRTLFREEMTPAQFVLEGSVDLTRAGEQIRTLGPGDWVGDAALLARRATESLSGVTSTPTRVLAFSRREFASLLHTVPAVRERLARPSHVNRSVDGRLQRVAPAPALSDRVFAEARSRLSA
jgi:CRP-like cAMP-binding protein